MLRQPNQSNSHFKGGIDVSSAIPPSIRLFVELIFLVGDTAQVVSSSATSTELDSTELHTVYSIYELVCPAQ